jgi:ADP-ribosylglycohydrolase
VDVALGTLLGACIGDAVGAPLEHLGRKPSEKEVKQALSLGGGGYHRTAPGQVTDDGELTISCALGLLNCVTGTSSSFPSSSHC